jgi:2-dehydro-3-deoxyphosphogluconate aldolase/(4S)-4-hydroxy-2-oxoglutarate aldolase
MPADTPIRSRHRTIRQLVEPGVIAVVRDLEPVEIRPLIEALLAGGVVAVELTLTTPGALEAVSVAVREFAGRVVVGVGSVLDAQSCRAALAAGADFIVSPVLRPELAAICHEAEAPVMLGAFTPTEAQNAHDAGADFVKIFPADSLGPAFIKAIRAPMPHLRLVPTGGVDVNTIGAFVKAGCVAVGAGSTLVSAAILKARNWAELTRLAAALVQESRRNRPISPA